MIFKLIELTDISSYKLVIVSDEIKKLRGPFEVHKASTSMNFGVLIRDNTYYDDTKRVGVRLISHYTIKRRSILFK